MRIDPILGFLPPVTLDLNQTEPMKIIQKQTPFKDTIGEAKEHYLNKAFINAMTEQRKNHNESSILTTETLKETLAANNEIRKEAYSEQEELIRKQKKSDILNIVDSVSMSGMVVTGVVTVGLTAFLGFAAVPLFLLGASALFAFVNGGTKIANGINTYQAKQIEGQIFELGEKRKVGQTKTAEYLEQQNSSQQKALDTYSMMSENETKKQETIRAVIERS